MHRLAHTVSQTIAQLKIESMQQVKKGTNSETKLYIYMIKQNKNLPDFPLSFAFVQLRWLFNSAGCSVGPGHWATHNLYLHRPSASQLTGTGVCWEKKENDLV